jgi:hypothetical protein
MQKGKDGFTGDYIRYNIAAAVPLYGIIINVADPDQSDKLDSDPLQFAQNKPKCMEYEPFFEHFFKIVTVSFIWKLGSGSRSGSK